MVCPIERNTFVAGCVSGERRGRYLCFTRGLIPAQTPLYCLFVVTSAQLTLQYCQVQDPAKGMTPPTTGWARLHQSEIKAIPADVPTGQPDLDSSSIEALR